MWTTTFLASLSILCAAPSPTDGAALPTIEPLLRTVDLNIGQQQEVELADGQKATVKLLRVDELRDNVRGALRQARVSVEVNGRNADLACATYHLPITVGGVQIDCPITKGYLENGDHWGLDADARLRLWPEGSPWVRPGTFSCPLHQRWLASSTLMANELGDHERPDDRTYYYHWGLDFARVKVVDPHQPDRQPPGVHAAYWPTFGLKPGDEVTFKARSFGVERGDGREEWDFGDGSPAAFTHSNSSSDAHAADGYAQTAHRYREPGHYIVTVQRRNQRGEIGVDHLHVVVER